MKIKASITLDEYVASWQISRWIRAFLASEVFWAHVCRFINLVCIQSDLFCSMISLLKSVYVIILWTMYAALTFNKLFWWMQILKIKYHYEDIESQLSFQRMSVESSRLSWCYDRIPQQAIHKYRFWSCSVDLMLQFGGGIGSAGKIK